MNFGEELLHYLSNVPTYCHKYEPTSFRRVSSWETVYNIKTILNQFPTYKSHHGNYKCSVIFFCLLLNSFIIKVGLDSPCEMTQLVEAGTFLGLLVQSPHMACVTVMI